MRTSEAILLENFLKTFLEILRGELQGMRMEVREIRRDVHKVDRKVSLMTSPATGRDIRKIEKWVVRLLTLAAPIGTLWVTGSWEAALRVLSQSFR